jgi:hypothetical protein
MQLSNTIRSHVSTPMPSDFANRTLNGVVNTVIQRNGRGIQQCLALPMTKYITANGASPTSRCIRCTLVYVWHTLS